MGNPNISKFFSVIRNCDVSWNGKTICFKGSIETHLSKGRSFPPFGTGGNSAGLKYAVLTTTLKKKEVINHLESIQRRVT